MEYDVDVLKIKKELPKELVATVERTIFAITRTLPISAIHEAILWQNFSLAFHYGEERGLQRGFEATLGAINRIGKHGK